MSLIMLMLILINKHIFRYYYIIMFIIMFLLQKLHFRMTKNKNKIQLHESKGNFLSHCQ